MAEVRWPVSTPRPLGHRPPRLSPLPYPASHHHHHSTIARRSHDRDPRAQLGFCGEEARLALSHCGGQVEAAVSLLLEQQDVLQDVEDEAEYEAYAPGHVADTSGHVGCTHSPVQRSHVDDQVKVEEKAEETVQVKAEAKEEVFVKAEVEEIMKVKAEAKAEERVQAVAEATRAAVGAGTADGNATSGGALDEHQAGERGGVSGGEAAADGGMEGGPSGAVQGGSVEVVSVEGGGVESEDEMFNLNDGDSSSDEAPPSFGRMQPAQAPVQPEPAASAKQRRRPRAAGWSSRKRGSAARK